MATQSFAANAESPMPFDLKPLSWPDMANKVRWGVLSTAGIGVKKVIPAMQKGEWIEIIAIASRDRGQAEETARTLGIAKAYGSYEELLADPQIEAIYNPLPNQLHVPWSIRAAEAGKHVLMRETAEHDGRRSQDSSGRAATHRRHYRRSLHGAHPSAMAAHPRTDYLRPDRPATFDPGLLQLLQHGSRRTSATYLNAAAARSWT